MRDYKREVDNRALREKTDKEFPNRKKLIRKILRKREADCEHPETCRHNRNSN